MMRKAGSYYEWRRSSTLLKVKTFSDEEAIVCSQHKGSGKNAAVMGHLACKTPDGRQFSVGSGFSDAQRHKPPAVGAMITYRYQELSNALIPRFPTFVDVRTDLVWKAYCAAYEKPDAKKVRKLKRTHTVMFTDKLGEGPGAGAGPAPPHAAKAEPAAKKKKKATKTVGQWMWQTGSHFGKGKYKEYDARTSMFVEKAFAAKKPEIKFNTAPRNVVGPFGGYIINFGDLEQRQAGDASRIRKVRRVEVEVDVAAEEEDASIMKAADVAAADMKMDIAEDGKPHARQLLLMAAGGVAEPASGGVAGAGRGGGPGKIVLPVSGDAVLLGNGAYGFTDPYMSGQQMELTALTTGKKPQVRVKTLGKNAAKVKAKGSTVWSTLAQGEETVLGDGAQLALLSDGSWMYNLVAPGAGGARRLTRTMTE